MTLEAATIKQVKYSPGSFLKKGRERKARTDENISICRVISAKMREKNSISRDDYFHFIASIIICFAQLFNSRVEKFVSMRIRVSEIAMALM